MENHYTWKYNRLPPNQKAVGFKLVFKVKYYLNRSVACYKVKLVIQCFSQIHRIDSNKMFSLTVRQESLQIFFAILYLLRLIVKKVDIVGAYLKSLLDDNDLPIFIKLSLGIKTFQSIRVELVSQLLRSIYRFRQSGRL